MMKKQFAAINSTNISNLGEELFQLSLNKQLQNSALSNNINTGEAEWQIKNCMPKPHLFNTTIG